ncbi:MAG: helix-turn-helix domain-containing protein, partial [Candidatus Thorarchaeota archaeon]|nr:helix-turn-helix domain-containing protein [Candidatus Thorarchaeota archaeon]
MPFSRAIICYEFLYVLIFLNEHYHLSPMLINKAYRYELDPNNSQRTSLLQHTGVARFAYNWGLAQRIQLFETNQGLARLTDAMKQH